MTDKPIIFSGPMVRALLDGRKHQTRRILKPQPDPALPIGGADFVVMPNERGSWCWLNGWDGSIIDRFSAPYAPGDSLWVRETWRSQSMRPDDVIYRADGESLMPWRSPIHMPRWASRLTLTVTDVRVQRLQEISEGDAEAEGVFRHVAEHSLDKVFRNTRGAVAIEYFCDLWNSLHGPDAWAANPWVAAYTFTVERRNIDEVRP